MSRQIYVHPNLVEIFSTENVRDSHVSGAPSLPAISRDTGGVGTCVPGKLRILSVLKANRRLVAYAQALRPGALAVDVNEQNVAGRSFYEALGFVVIGRSPLDDTGRPYPILHMRRDAPGGAEGSRAALVYATLMNARDSGESPCC
jgi:hypothetical protein